MNLSLVAGSLMIVAAVVSLRESLRTKGKTAAISTFIMVVAAAISFLAAFQSGPRGPTLQDAAMTKPNVLILCTGNSARSQMAEGFLKHFAGERFAVHSAGMKPAEQVNPFAVQAMRELGIDISGQHPKHANEFLGRVPVAYLITVCAAADSQCPVGIAGVSERLAWPFDDPAAIEGTDEEKLAGFRRIRDEIRVRIKTWVDSLPDESNASTSSSNRRTAHDSKYPSDQSGV